MNFRSSLYFSNLVSIAFAWGILTLYIYLYDLFRYEMNTSYWAQRYVKDFKLFRFYIDNKVFFLSFKEVFFIFLHIDSE